MDANFLKKVFNVVCKGCKETFTEFSDANFTITVEDYQNLNYVNIFIDFPAGSPFENDKDTLIKFMQADGLKRSEESFIYEIYQVLEAQGYDNCVVKLEDWKIKEPCHIYGVETPNTAFFSFSVLEMQ